MATYFFKGSAAIVTGRLQIRNWEDKEGNKRRSAEILADHVYFGEAKRDSQKTTYAPEDDFPVMDGPEPPDLPF